MKNGWILLQFNFFRDLLLGKKKKRKICVFAPGKTWKQGMIWSLGRVTEHEEEWAEENGGGNRRQEANTQVRYYGVRSGTKSILRFRGLRNTSSLRKLFFESLSVVFVASVPCLLVVTSLVSSYCFLRGTAGFSSWRRYGLMSSLRHFYVFVSSGFPYILG